MPPPGRGATGTGGTLTAARPVWLRPSASYVGQYKGSYAKVFHSGSTAATGVPQSGFFPASSAARFAVPGLQRRRAPRRNTVRTPRWRMSSLISAIRLKPVRRPKATYTPLSRGGRRIVFVRPSDSETGVPMTIAKGPTNCPSGPGAHGLFANFTDGIEPCREGAVRELDGLPGVRHTVRSAGLEELPNRQGRSKTDQGSRDLFARPTFQRRCPRPPDGCRASTAGLVLKRPPPTPSSRVNQLLSQRLQRRPRSGAPRDLPLDAQRRPFRAQRRPGYRILETSFAKLECEIVRCYKGTF